MKVSNLDGATWGRCVPGYEREAQRRLAATRAGGWAGLGKNDAPGVGNTLLPTIDFAERSRILGPSGRDQQTDNAAPETADTRRRSTPNHDRDSVARHSVRPAVTIALEWSQKITDELAGDPGLAADGYSSLSRDRLALEGYRLWGTSHPGPAWHADQA